MPGCTRNPRRALAFAVLLVALQAPETASAQGFLLGGSVRAYQFLRVGEAFGQERRDAELGVLRLTGEVRLPAGFTLEAHGVIQALSPPVLSAARVAASSSSGFLPLERTLLDSSRGDIDASFDRLNLRLDRRRFRVTAGRQAVTWGVTWFWPAMDLFSPFAPERVDRDYKPGVDALRITVPLSAFSEVEVIGAVLGSSLSREGAAAALARIHLGSADLGLMGGKFHRDTVGGVFLTSDLRGTGLRAEATWTRSGDPEDDRRGRSRFVRGAVGIDRQMTAHLLLTLEFAWNGYGTARASEYVDRLGADRVLRGEVNALGKAYGGVAASWQLHPLWVLSNALLVNANDPSALWIPSLVRSTGNNSELLFGAWVGIGPGRRPGGAPRSEYGSVPASLFVGLKAYF